MIDANEKSLISAWNDALRRWDVSWTEEGQGWDREAGRGGKEDTWFLK